MFSQNSPQSNILCRKSDDQEEILVNTGLLKLTENCKTYTENVIPEPQAILGTTNLTINITSLRLPEDDCCVKLKGNISLEEDKMIPIKLHNLNLEELQYAQQKLREID